MGYATTFSYCVSPAAGDCLNAATGSGLVKVTGPDGNSSVYDYDQGTLAAQSSFTGTTLTAEQDYVADTNAGGTSGGSLLDGVTTDGDGNLTSYAYDPAGNVTSSTAPDGVGGQSATTTDWSTRLGEVSCATDVLASAACSASLPGPVPVTPGGVITPPSAPPPLSGTVVRCAATPPSPSLP